MCSWSIRVAIGERILLEFLEFDLENDTKCQSDHLTVYVDEDSRIGDGGSIYTNYNFAILLPSAIGCMFHLMTLLTRAVLWRSTTLSNSYWCFP